MLIRQPLQGKGEVVFARVSSYRGDIDRLVEGFERTIEPLEAMDGFVRGLLLADRRGSRGLTVTVWESEAAMSASDEWARKAREHAAHTAAATIESVDTYEIALTAEKR
jgi:heme-degrading monooxygenase HmoA